MENQSARPSADNGALSSVKQGGIHIDGGSSVQVGGHIVGGDFVSHGEEFNGEKLAELFEPLIAVIQNASDDVSVEAGEVAAALQAEVSKKESADDKVIGGLIQDLVDLVPTAVGAIGTIFGGPLLGGLVGPATEFVLERVGATT